MNFTETSISSIKSISQKSLAMAWSRAVGDADYPPCEAWVQSDRGHDPKFMVIWQVIGSGNQRDFRATYQGAHIATAFHANWVGGSMAQLVPEALRPAALAAAHHCATHGCGIYMVYRAVDKEGHSIDSERMLLPYGTKSNGVQQIVASIEAISLTGKVVLSETVSHFTAAFEIERACWFPPARSAAA